MEIFLSNLLSEIMWNVSLLIISFFFSSSYVVLLIPADSTLRQPSFLSVSFNFKKNSSFIIWYSNVDRLFHDIRLNFLFVSTLLKTSSICSSFSYYINLFKSSLSVRRSSDLIFFKESRNYIGVHHTFIVSNVHNFVGNKWY